MDELTTIRVTAAALPNFARDLHRFLDYVQQLEATVRWYADALPGDLEQDDGKRARTALRRLVN